MLTTEVDTFVTALHSNPREQGIAIKKKEEEEEELGLYLQNKSFNLKMIQLVCHLG